MSRTILTLVALGAFTGLTACAGALNQNPEPKAVQVQSSTPPEEVRTTLAPKKKVSSSTLPSWEEVQSDLKKGRNLANETPKLVDVVMAIDKGQSLSGQEQEAFMLLVIKYDVDSSVAVADALRSSKRTAGDKEILFRAARSILTRQRVAIDQHCNHLNWLHDLFAIRNLVEGRPDSRSNILKKECQDFQKLSRNIQVFQATLLTP